MDNLVSVIIPTHGGGEFIQRAVDSVLAQTYKAVEVIVVDDNGKDSSGQLETQSKMEKYKEDSRVKYIVHEVNKNGSVARNTGIRASQGEYIAFLDDDDAFAPQNVEKHMEKMEEIPREYGATYCKSLKIREGMSDEISSLNKSGDLLKEFAQGKIEIATSVLVIRRESMNYLKEWDESFKRHQDWEFVLRLLDHYKIQHVDFVGVTRYITERHGASNPDRYRDNRLHYLNKMQYIFNKLDTDSRKEVYNNHYSDIGKEYFKDLKLVKSIVWACKTTAPIKTVCGYFKAGFRYFNKKLKKKK